MYGIIIAGEKYALAYGIFFSDDERLFISHKLKKNSSPSLGQLKKQCRQINTVDIVLS